MMRRLIWLQTATLFWLSGTPFLSAVQCPNVYLCYKDRQTDIHTRQPLVPEPSAFDIELATENLKGH
jgi:hypothetical protein